MADLSPVPPAVPQQQPLSPVPPRRPSLDDVVFGAFGMDPSLKRATLLPAAMNAAGEREWAVPQAFEERPPYPSENEYFKGRWWDMRIFAILEHEWQAGKGPA